MKHASGLLNSVQHVRSRYGRLVKYFLAGFFLLLWFGALDERELFHPDEGRYAEIPHEMLASGDWITPHLNGLKYFEKPVLQYWITAAAYLIFGEEEFVARLWPALAGFLTLVLVYYLGRRLSGVRAGVIAAAVLATSFQFFVFSQILTLDIGLCFFMTLTLYGFVAAQDLRLSLMQQRNWAVAMWGAMALAVLSKGLVGAVLPAMILFAYMLIEWDWKILKRLHWRVGIPIFLVIALPWFIAVQVRNPEFFQFFFVHEHFGRFALNEHHRSGGWYYFIVMLFVGSLPWTFEIFRATRNSWALVPAKHLAINPFHLLILWAAVITIFYSVSRSKLPGYILPVYPALAVLLGCYAQHKKLQLTKSLLCGFAGLGIAIILAAPLLLRVPKFAANADFLAPYLNWAMAGGAILAMTAFVAMATRARHLRFAVGALGFGILLSFQMWVTGAESIEDQFSGETLVEDALDKIGDFEPDAPFYSVNMYDQTIPHHIGRTLTVAGFRGELAMGIAQDPEKFVSNVDEFRRRWQSHRQAYAIMPCEQLDAEQIAGTPLQVLSRNHSLVIVARAAVADEVRPPRRPDR
jgi:Aminoarabinose transferase C-terminal domain/Dolichyl-phosphate-mannose-protein mannosyltransferase